MNKVELTGRLTKDPELRYTTGENAAAFCRFSLAVNRRFKREGDPDADFINCVAFGKTAEVVSKYYIKGQKMDLTGRIQTGSYTDRNGQKIYTTNVVVEEAEFGESKKASGYSASVQHAASSEASMNIPDGTDEELPFS